MATELNGTTVRPDVAPVKQGKFCNGICYRYERNRPFREPYSEHCYCSRCVVWLQLAALKDNKCPCCKFRPKMKSYRKRGTKNG